MHLYSHIAAIAATLQAFSVHVDARALPEGQLTSRDQYCYTDNCKVTINDVSPDQTAPVHTRSYPEAELIARDQYCHTDNCKVTINDLSPDSSASAADSFYPRTGDHVLEERAPVVIAPKVKPGGAKPKGSGSGAAGDSPASQPGTPKEGDTPNIARLGIDDGTPSANTGDKGKGPARLGVEEGDTSSNPGGDRTPEQIANDKYNADIKQESLGASIPRDGGVEPDRLLGGPADMKKFEEKGPRVDKEVMEANANPKDAPTPKFEDGYTAKTGKSSKFDDQSTDLDQPFNDLGINKGRAKFTESQVTANEGNNGGLPTTHGKYMAKEGVIIGEARKTENDGNPVGKKIQSSSLVFQQWQSMAKDKVNQLKAFVGRDIVSRSFLESMQKSQRDVGARLDSTTSFKRPETPYDPAGGKPKTPEQSAWDRMLGTDAISSINYMLKDHAKSLGGKQINEIKVYPRTYDPATGAGQEKVTFMLVFGKGA